MPGAPHSATSVATAQPRCAWPDARLQFPSFGPRLALADAVQIRIRAIEVVVPGLVVSSVQPLGLVGSPSRPQPQRHPGTLAVGGTRGPDVRTAEAALAAADRAVDGPPAGSGQSLLSSQTSALPLLHVSQRHLLPAASVQFGLAAVSVFTTVLVLLLRSIVRVAMIARRIRRTIETGPTEVRTIRNLAVGIAREALTRGPPSQVPVVTVSLMAPTSLHRGHGLSTAMPL